MADNERRYLVTGPDTAVADTDGLIRCLVNAEHADECVAWQQIDHTAPASPADADNDTDGA